MKNLASGILGIMGAALSAIFVFSILSLAVVEGMITLPPTATIRPTLLPPNLTPVYQTTSPAFLRQTPTLPQLPTQCPPPVGWQPYIVQPGDNLADLAASHGIPLDALMANNCLISSQLFPDTIIYLPPLWTATPAINPSLAVVSPTACISPPGWIKYTIRSGDTLSKISQLFQVSISILIEANCLTSEYIVAGNTLWVPNVATITPMVTVTATRTQILPSDTPSPLTITPTLAASLEPTPTPTITDTLESTNTSTPTPSGTPTITPTLTPNPGQTKKTEEG